MFTLRTLLVLLCLVPVLPAQRESGQPRAWEHQTSDIAVNPRIHFGELDNGVRWAWMKNSEPHQRCYLRLHVDVGSLSETDSEQGLAHFLEHMAFNGSEHFPAGTLVEWFQKHGMAFGADTNASTDFSATVYKLDLPTSDEATIRTGMTMLSDVAGGLLLASEEVKAEIGVIDGEERERDSAGFRAQIAAIKDEFAGTTVATRIPIGIKSVRAAFDATSVRAFYERWYRPENLTVIVAGDLGELDPEALIKEYFSSIAAPGTLVAPEPPRGTPALADDTFAYHSAEIPTVTLSAERLKAFVDEPDNKAIRTRDVPLQYARRMLNLRFRELAKKPDAPFLAAGVNEAGGLLVLDGEELSVTAEPAQWQAALATCEQELRRALTFGFQQAELDEVRKNALRSLDEAVESESTRGTASFVQELVGAAEERYVPTDAATDRALMRPVIEALTVAACQAAFVKAWNEGSLRLSAVGGLDLGDGAGAALKDAWEASRKVEVTAPAALSTAAFAYASSPDEAGAIAERKHIEDLGLEQVRFANGVRLNVKQTDFKERQVLVSARVGSGLLAVDSENAQLAPAAGACFIASGLLAHSADDLRRLMAGREVGVSFGVDQDAFSLGGATTPDDLLLQLELACAYLTHPGWRPEGLAEWKQQLGPTFEALQHQLPGPVTLHFLSRLHGGDRRFGLPSKESLDGVTGEALKAWLGPELASGPIEVSIVGDVDVDAAIGAVAQTFGMLPERGAARVSPDRLAVTVASGLHESASVETEDPKALLVLAFPTTDGKTALTRRRLTMLGSVLNDRLRVEVREKLGAAYSPRASSTASKVFPGLGYAQAQIVSAPENVQDVQQAVLGVTDALAADGVTADELERQKEPLLKSLRDQMRTNTFWTNLLEGCQARPVVLEEARTVQSDYEAMQTGEISALAKQYLQRERASWIVVRPIAPPAPADAAAPAGEQAPGAAPSRPGGS